MTDRKQICLDYYYQCRKKNSGTKEGLNRLFYAGLLREIWSAFEAFLGLEFPAHKPWKMQEDYAKEYEKVFVKWTFSTAYTDSLKELIRLSPVKDESPKNPFPPLDLSNSSSFYEIIRYLYRIRSNLDHGAKNLLSDTPEGQRDRELVEHGFKVTFEILEKTLLNEKWI